MSIVAATALAACGDRPRSIVAPSSSDLSRVFNTPDVRWEVSERPEEDPRIPFSYVKWYSVTTQDAIAIHIEMGMLEKGAFKQSEFYGKMGYADIDLETGSETSDGRKILSIPIGYGAGGASYGFMVRSVNPHYDFMLTLDEHFEGGGTVPFNIEQKGPEVIEELDRLINPDA